MYIPGDRVFKVEWRALRALNGLDLKVYIFVVNQPDGISDKQIAEAFGMDIRTVLPALFRLLERYYLEKKNGLYRLRHFPLTPLKDHFDFS